MINSHNNTPISQIYSLAPLYSHRSYHNTQYAVLGITESLVVVAEHYNTSKNAHLQNYVLRMIVVEGINNCYSHVIGW
jgi:hypothetical protein